MLTGRNAKKYYNKRKATETSEANPDEKPKVSDADGSQEPQPKAKAKADAKSTARKSKPKKWFWYCNCSAWVILDPALYGQDVQCFSRGYVQTWCTDRLLNLSQPTMVWNNLLNYFQLFFKLLIRITSLCHRFVIAIQAPAAQRGTCHMNRKLAASESNITWEKVRI